jgi:uncharacterized phage-like protein YoqJ
MILAVTGHRPPRLGGFNVPNPVFDAVMRALDEQLMSLQPEMVLTGMGLGVDQWAADLCRLNEIPYTAVIPFEGYQNAWPAESRRTYDLLIRDAALVRTLASEPPEGANVAGLLRTRNRYLINESDALLAVYSQIRETGTGQAVGYAMEQHRPVYFAQIRPEMWALARTEWERFQAQKAFREAQHREVAVRGLRQRVTPAAVRPEPPTHFSRQTIADREDFAAHRFPDAVREANDEKRAEKIKEDVNELKPRRIIEV